MSVDEGPGASDSPTPVTYALGRDAAEAERLRRQTIELEPLAAELLDRVGAAEGQSAIDVGCGPRGIHELLAERVGPRGRVVGLEVDPVHVAMARELVAERGLTNVEVIQADARNTGLPPASFDVAHARTERPRSRSGTGGNDAAGPSGRLGRQPGAGRGRPPVSPSQPRLGPTA